MATILAVSGLAVALPACAPLRATSGYQAIEHQPKDMKIGEDTKSTVLDQLGSPSAQSTFDPNVWYYVSQRSAQVGYHKPHVTRRSVVAITFDKESEKVTKVDAYGLKDRQRRRLQQPRDADARAANCRPSSSCSATSAAANSCRSRTWVRASVRAAGRTVGACRTIQKQNAPEPKLRGVPYSGLTAV